MNPFSKSILDWYAENGRDLPWRRTPAPYPVWLSEIILQQTRIAQGTAYWHRFLERFPTVESLAEASEDEVLRLWEGLGYYSRARNLHAAAKQIVALGGFPTTLEGIRSLKGVGDYTAAAIGSICFGIPAPVVDGNVYRVLARHFGIATPVGTPQAKKEFTALAARLLPSEDPAAFNQGLMDFGALQCTPQNPSCLSCPLQGACNAFRTGRVELLPVKKPQSKPVERHLSYIYVRVDGCTAIRRRGPGDIWQGLYEPIVFATDGGTTPPNPLSRFAPNEPIVFSTDGGTTPPNPLSRFAPNEPLVKEAIGSHAQGKLCYGPRDSSHVFPPQTCPGRGEKLLRQGIKHQLTHRTIIADFYLWEPKERPELPEGYFWIRETELDKYGKPRLFELLLEEILRR